MRRLKSSEIEREVALCNVRFSTVCDKIKKQKDQLRSFIAPRGSVRGPLQAPDTGRAQVLGQ
jgi:hypothetical protein